MAHYPYLIIGGGMAADAAVRGIRELDADRPIGLIGEEADPPYARPPLSKGLWKGEPLDSVWRNTGERGVDLHLGRRAAALDLPGKRVIDDGSREYTFEKLLIATGALAEQGKSFAVIGGGFIGSEIAAALAMQGCKVTLLFPDDGIGARLFPADLARFLVGYYGEKGVEALPGEQVTGLSQAGIGIVPNTHLAEAAGLEVEDGIVVDTGLRTSHPDVFAAGDVARFDAPSLGRMRVEHEDNAVTMGRAAGRAMAGDPAAYSHLPYFYSDLFELGYEAVGQMDPRGEMVADWKQPFREGVVYYLRNGRVRGVLLWNTWDQVDAARSLIAAPGPFSAAELVGRLPS